MQANKDAFFYVLDRVTGQFISAAPFSQVTWASGLDPKTGRPIVNKEAYYGTTATLVTPGGGGAHNWSPMAFNPMTGLTYVPTSTLNTFSYAVEQPFNPRPGSMTGTVRPAPAPAAPAPPAIGPPPIEGAGGARRARRLGCGGRSRCGGARRAAAASAAARSPRRRTWCSRCSSNGHLLAYTRRQRREAGGHRHRAAQRHGAAHHVSRGRQAVRGADGWRGPGRRGRQRRARQSADAVHAEAPGVCRGRDRSSLPSSGTR